MDLGMMAFTRLLQHACNIMFEEPELRMDDFGIWYWVVGVKCTLYDREGHIVALAQFDTRILNYSLQSAGRRRRSSSQPRSLER